MKSSKIIKAFMILLSLVMVISVFAGCQGGSTPATTGSAGTTKAAQTTKADDKPYFNLTGYPIVDDQITLSLMISKSPAHGDFNDMYVFKAFEELTNVKLDFLMIDSGSWNERKNLALASGDLPDFFWSGISIADEAMYGVQGDTFVPLDDLIDKYAPNIKKLYADYPEDQFGCTAPDGNMYMLPYHAETLTVAGSTLYVRGDFVDQTVEKRPDTLDEFYDMLVAFKGLGDDITPIVPANFGVLKQYLINAFGEQIDILYGADEDDNVVFVPATEEYKRMIEFLNKLFTEKLLDNEVFTQTGEQADAKVTEGKAGCMTFGTLLLPRHYASGKNETELLKPLTSQYTNNRKIYGRYPASVGYGVITKANKYPEATMRWLDMNYSDEDIAPGINSITLWLGIRDQQWEFKDANKEYYGRMMPEDSQISEVEWSNRYVTYGNGPCKLVLFAIPYENPGQEMKARQSVANWFPYAQLPFPNQYMRYPEEDQSRLNTAATDIETLATQMEAKFITGEEPLSKWDDYVSNLNKAGMQDVIRIKQDAYEVYKSAAK